MKPINTIWMRLIVSAVLLVPCWSVLGYAAQSAQGAVFAVVDGAVISAREFDGALSAAVRQKFYHRQPHAEQLAELRAEVAEQLVNRQVLLREAQRRGVQADEAKVKAELAAFEERNRKRPEWQQNRDHMLPVLTRALHERNLIEQLEATVRAAPLPTEAQLRTFYASRLDAFTEPARLRFAMILLKVDPIAPSEAWEEAVAHAQELIDRLAKGAEFAELARRHSNDPSAERGGDMGYRHRGMLPAGVESAIEKLAPGEVSQPFRLLEGIAVFRFTERKPAQLRAFDEVRRNVAELWARAKGEAQWRELIAKLRAGAKISMGADPVPASSIGGDASAVGAAR